MNKMRMNFRDNARQLWYADINTNFGKFIIDVAMMWKWKWKCENTSSRYCFINSQSCPQKIPLKRKPFRPNIKWFFSLQTNFCCFPFIWNHKTRRKSLASFSKRMPLGMAFLFQIKFTKNNNKKIRWRRSGTRGAKQRSHIEFITPTNFEQQCQRSGKWDGRTHRNKIMSFHWDNNSGATKRTE